MALPKLLPAKLNVSQFFDIVMALIIMSVYVHLMFQPPSWSKKKLCPETFYSSLTHDTLGTIQINCSAIIADSQREIQKAEDYKRCKSPEMSEKTYIEATQDCAGFIRDRGYTSYPLEQEELDFPVAFSLLTYEQVEQTERLLRAIYRPQNFYCIHVDHNARSIFAMALQSIAKCFDNVFLVEKPVRIRWAEYPVLEAELLCMEQLMAVSQKWKYFINLTGREFPLRTNLELVRILKAYNGSNDIDGSAHGRPLSWTKYVWRTEAWRSSREKPPPPGDFLICKGSAHVAAARPFVEYVIHNKSAHALRDWMRDIRAPDEHFFQSLNHNPHKGVPGSFKGDPDLKVFQTRYKVWESNDETCSGTWRNFICNFGAGDLPRVTQARQMFANKFRYEEEPVAYECMEKWYMHRAQQGLGPGFDVDFYKNQPWVSNHL